MFQIVLDGGRKTSSSIRVALEWSLSCMAYFAVQSRLSSGAVHWYGKPASEVGLDKRDAASFSQGVFVICLFVENKAEVTKTCHHVQ